MDTAEEIRKSLQPLMQEARDKGFWMHCPYSNIWMTPDELDVEHDSYRLLWGPVNWQVKDPQELVDTLDQKILNVEAERRRILKRISRDSKD